MKHLFIINPAAGKYDRSHEVLEKLTALTHGLELDWDYAFTERPWHGAELARAAAERGEPIRIYACGGDGTLNEVIGGAAGFDNAAVTHYPTGSGNDFIKIFGPDAPLFYDLRELLRRDEAALDLIDCNGRLAVNICSLGFDARVGLGMADFKRYPLVSGSMAYQLSLIKNVAAGIHRPYKINLDGEISTATTPSWPPATAGTTAEVSTRRPRRCPTTASWTLSLSGRSPASRWPRRSNSTQPAARRGWAITSLCAGGAAFRWSATG